MAEKAAAEKCSIETEIKIFGEKNKSGDDVSKMRDRLPKQKRIVSPGILKISRLFEKEAEEEKIVKQESRVEKIKNSLELMMSDSKVRKTKFEAKKEKKRKRVTSATEYEGPQRTIMENWVKGGNMSTSNVVINEVEPPTKRNMSE